MIYGIGIDLTEIDRVEHAWKKNYNFAKRVLTPTELEIFAKLGNHRKSEFIAGRFSAKESFAKAFGTGIGSAVAFQDLEIIPTATGKPVFTRYPRATDFQVQISISHTTALVMTEVILEKKEKIANG
ncbi:MAG: holo-ACP synthase [Liquorilactobacillus ghanensis]|uniref:holo-ACP synthase n=1 Tax=Liquorilactobacillus ghanensis TaxID=399370 RepID=UPI0039EA8897